MRAYGEWEHGGKYILENYTWSRNHHRSETIRRWKRDLKKKARKKNKVYPQSYTGERRFLDGLV